MSILQVENTLRLLIREEIKLITESYKAQQELLVKILHDHALSALTHINELLPIETSIVMFWSFEDSIGFSVDDLISKSPYVQNFIDDISLSICILVGKPNLAWRTWDQINKNIIVVCSTDLASFTKNRSKFFTWAHNELASNTFLSRQKDAKTFDELSHLIKTSVYDFMNNGASVRESALDPSFNLDD